MKIDRNPTPCQTTMAKARQERSMREGMRTITHSDPAFIASPLQHARTATLPTSITFFLDDHRRNTIIRGRRSASKPPSTIIDDGVVADELGTKKNSF
jgi:hypothetical protein